MVPIYWFWQIIAEVINLFEHFAIPYKAQVVLLPNFLQLAKKENKETTGEIPIFPISVKLTECNNLFSRKKFWNDTVVLWKLQEFILTEKIRQSKYLVIYLVKTVKTLFSRIFFQKWLNESKFLVFPHCWLANNWNCSSKSF